jgi:putative transposase
MTHTHVMRWHTAHRTVGTGPLYQGRFKAYPVQADSHFLTVCRYVERNALKAGLVDRAEDWQWCSLWRRRHRSVTDDVPALTPWPVPRPRQWSALVNRPQSEADHAAVDRSMRRGCPLGTPAWTTTMVDRLKLAHTQRNPGRPRKQHEP